MADDPLKDIPEPAWDPLLRLAFAIFHQSFVEAKVKERERAVGIDPDRPGDAPADWAELEKLLGKETVDRMRRGGG